MAVNAVRDAATAFFYGYKAQAFSGIDGTTVLWRGTMLPAPFLCLNTIEHQKRSIKCRLQSTKSFKH